MTDTETVQQFAIRRGFTWAEWKSLPAARRFEESALDRGETVTEAMRAGWSVMGLPAAQRLAAFKSLVGGQFAKVV